MIWFNVCQVYIILYLKSLIFIPRKPNTHFNNFEGFGGPYKFSLLLGECKIKRVTFPENKFSPFDIHFTSSILLSARI